MNIIVYGLMCVLALLGCFRDMKKEKNSILPYIVVALFILAVISRKDHYFDYSDLNAYISRFQANDVSYFGRPYEIFCNLIRAIFGTSAIGYLGSISFFIAVVAIIGLCEWNRSKSRICLSTFLLIFLVYWGVVFSAEVIRTGLAISCSLASIGFAKNKKKFFSLIFLIFSILFHWTEIFICPIVILVYFEKQKAFCPVKNETIVIEATSINYSSLKSSNFTSKYFIWMIALMLLDLVDISKIILDLLRPILATIITMLGKGDHYLVYLEATSRTSVFSYISVQYLYYRLIGLYLVLINRKSNSSKALLFSYFIGLSVFTAMNAIAAVARMQWIFITPFVFLLYDYFQSGCPALFNKKIEISIFTILQLIMAINYLGYYI